MNARAILGVIALSAVFVHAADRPASTPNPKDAEFRQARPGHRFEFPRDHASHPDFKTEWWYFTGHLAEAGSKGDTLGYELTFFRTALKPAAATTHSAWSVRDVVFAHFAITDLKRKEFWFTEKISRGALGLAGADSTKLHCWIEDWSLDDEGGGAWSLRAKAEGRSLDLVLKPEKPPVIHGTDGISRKAEGTENATHYISFTRMKTSGRVTLPGRESAVKGVSWHDHEFGSSLLTDEQAGWDWFSLQFDNGTELMIYLLRKKNGCYDKASSGTWVDAKGVASHLTIGEVSVISRAKWRSPDTGAEYPSGWEIRVPTHGVNVAVVPLIEGQEVRAGRSAGVTYWEGACGVTGSHPGRAYVELTGYAGQKSKQ